MRSTTIPFPWRANAIALALGLAVIGPGAGLARSETANPPSQPAAAATRPAQQAAAPGFVCDADPGGWCDLRDWRAFGQAPASVPSN